jgi:hypothetical protein
MLEASARTAGPAEGCLPPLPPQVVAEQECRRGAQRAEDAYRRAFDDGVAADEAALAREHEGALAAARRVFKELAVGDKGTRRAHKLDMLRACETRWVGGWV